MSYSFRSMLAAIPLGIVLAGPALAAPILSLKVTGGTNPLVFNSTPDNDISYGGTYATANGVYTLILGGSGNESNLTLTVLVSRVTGTPDPITVALTETDIPAFSYSNFSLSTSSTSNLFTTSQTGFRSYVNPSDTAFGTEQLLGSVDRTGPNNFAYGPVTTVEALTSPFSLTLIRTLTPVSGAHPQLTAETDITSVPEPATLTLFAGGMLILLGTRMRSRT